MSVLMKSVNVGISISLSSCELHIEYEASVSFYFVKSVIF